MKNLHYLTLLILFGCTTSELYSQSLPDYFPQDNAASSSDNNSVGQFVNEKPELLTVGNDSDLRVGSSDSNLMPQGIHYLELLNDGSGSGANATITISFLPGEYKISGYFRKTAWTNAALHFNISGQQVSIGLLASQQDRINEWVYDEATFTLTNAADIEFSISSSLSTSATAGHIAYFDGISITREGDEITTSNNSLWNSSAEGINYTAGNVAIGTDSNPILNGESYKLAVNGKIITEEVKVQLNQNWPDYVFKKDYDLPSLEEIEQHITEKGHLINIPSAKEVKTNGISLGEMNSLLLEKIEELTLHLIQVKKELNELKAKQ